MRTRGADVVEELVTERQRIPVVANIRQHVCLGCGERRPLFRYRGGVKADRDHTLCFRYYRALHDSTQALRLAHRS